MVRAYERAQGGAHSDRRYSTGGSLDTYSALIQNFYTQEIAPAAAVHVLVDTGAEEGAPPAVKAYIS
jgi:translation initiation factor 3 subunit F